MKNIFEINKKKIFSLEEAENLLPLVYRITDEASKRVKKLINQVDAFQNKKDPRALELESIINSLVTDWQNKVERLGLKPKGLWLADFDNGTGYYCWKFPETKIQFTHGYKEGYSCRKSLDLSDQLLN